MMVAATSITRSSGAYGLTNMASDRNVNLPLLQPRPCYGTLHVVPRILYEETKTFIDTCGVDHCPAGLLTKNRKSRNFGKGNVLMTVSTFFNR